MRQTQDAGVVEREQTVWPPKHHPISAGIQGLRPPMDMCMKYTGKYMYMS